MQLEKDHAHLTVWDENSKLLVNFTGHNTPINLITRSSEVLLKFKSDHSLNAKDFKGFSLSYTSVVVGSQLPFLISASNALIKTYRNQSIDKILYNSVEKYKIIDYDSIEGTLILYDPESNSIVSDLNENDILSITDINNSIAYDWIHRLLFHIDLKTKTLKVIDFNDKNFNTYSISEVNNKFSRDLVINIENSVLVWSQIGNDPKLWQINFDGTEQTVLYSNLRQTFHLTVDYETKRYYFVDITDYSLFSIDFNGNNEKILITSKKLFDSIVSMKILNNDIYLSNNYFIYKITDLSSGLKRAEILLTCGEQHSIDANLFYKFKSLDIKRPKIFDFTLIDEKLRPNVSNKCLDSKCDGLCLPTPHSYQCLSSEVTNSAVIMVSGNGNSTLAIFNSVIIVILIVLMILMYLR